MSTPDLSAKLPPPHDDEPAQLRSDILDELQDHLNCAAERERRRLQLSDQPADQASVWTAVIERFGDPSALARRLWLDAMKGRIMTQRVLIGMVGLLTVLVGVLVWRSFFYVPQPLIDERAMAAMIERVRKEVATTPAVTSQEWVPVKYRLVLGAEAGPAVVGQAVNLRQNAQAQNSVGRLGDMKEVTNSEGVVDFGLLPYGSYSFWIDTQFGRLFEVMSVRPGRPIDSLIVIPDAQKTQRVQFEYSEPDWKSWGWVEGPPPGSDFALMIDWYSEKSVSIGGHKWQNNASQGSALLRPDGLHSIGEYPDEPSRRLCLSLEPIEEVRLLPDEVMVTAHWWYNNGGEEKEDPQSRKMYKVYSPVAELGWKPSVDIASANAKKFPESFPLTFPLNPRQETHVIRIPVNHPYTYTRMRDER